MPRPHVAVIIGSSQGLGLHLTRAYLARTDLHIVSLSRNPDQARKAILDTKGTSPLSYAQGHPSNGSSSSSDAEEKLARGDAAHMSTLSSDRLLSLPVDVRDEDSIAKAADSVREAYGEGSLKLLFNVAGRLHPEKNLGQVQYDEMLEQFKLNAFFPLLSFKHFAPLLPKPATSAREQEDAAAAPCLSHGLLPRDLSIVASLSARVGSIADNQRGGWYSYRASKAAQNQFTRSLSRELHHRNLNAAALALHPGTVRTELSREFTGGAGSTKEKAEGEFEADEAARNLVRVIKGVKREDNGKFLDWRGQEVPW